jgi:hypothetical protein
MNYLRAAPILAQLFFVFFPRPQLSDTKNTRNKKKSLILIPNPQSFITFAAKSQILQQNTKRNEKKST